MVKPSREFHGGGQDMERIVRHILMDSKAFLITFGSDTDESLRMAWFTRVDQIYKEIGGGSINAQQDPDNADRYLIKPVDDPPDA